MLFIKTVSEWFSNAEIMRPRLYSFIVHVVTCLKRNGRKTCYHYRKGLKRLTWKEARYECMNSGSDLISIRDPEEDEHIHSWLLQIQFSNDDRSIFLGERLYFVHFSSRAVSKSYPMLRICTKWTENVVTIFRQSFRQLEFESNIHT